MPPELAEPGSGGWPLTQQILTELRDMPGVEAASVVNLMPLTAWAASTRVEVRSGEEPRVVRTNDVGPGYFETLQIALLQGRAIDESDREDGPPVVVVNQTAARTLWPDANPIGQRLPRKFKINFSGCATDCGQAMFNDAGVIAVRRKREDGTFEAGFRVYVAGGLGATPHPALALEEFTTREELLPTLEAILRVFDHHGNRENKLRARMKWLVDKIGFDEVQRQVLRERKFLVASAGWPGGSPTPTCGGPRPSPASAAETAATFPSSGSGSRGTSPTSAWPAGCSP